MLALLRGLPCLARFGVDRSDESDTGKVPPIAAWIAC